MKIQIYTVEVIISYYCKHFYVTLNANIDKFTLFNYIYIYMCVCVRVRALFKGMLWGFMLMFSLVAKARLVDDYIQVIFGIH